MWITSTCPVLQAQSTDVPHRTTSTLCQLQNRWAFWDLGSENRLTHNLCKQRVSAILALLQPATVPMRRFVRLSHGGKLGKLTWSRQKGLRATAFLLGNGWFAKCIPSCRFVQFKRRSSRASNVSPSGIPQGRPTKLS